MKVGEHHLSGFPAGIGTGSPRNGCRSFPGPVPPLLVMKNMNLSGTASLRKDIRFLND